MHNHQQKIKRSNGSILQLINFYTEQIILMQIYI